MKVILYMAVSADGFIAKEDGATPWPDEEWAAYARTVQSVGNLVIGKKTYELMKAKGEFAILGDSLILVVSRNELFDEGVVRVSSPEHAVQFLQEKGFENLLLGGGSVLNASFLEKGLIDELCLDIEQVAFGSGIPLFAHGGDSLQLVLLGKEQLSPTTIQEQYRVVE